MTIKNCILRSAASKINQGNHTIHSSTPKAKFGNLGFIGTKDSKKTDNARLNSKMRIN